MNGNDPAFPNVMSDRESACDPVQKVWSEGGLTKREFFAALAMQGYLSTNAGQSHHPKELAVQAIVRADALLEGLTKNTYSELDGWRSGR